MPTTSRRTSVFTESLIREMSRVAARHGAINLAQASPAVTTIAGRSGAGAAAAAAHKVHARWRRPERVVLGVPPQRAVELVGPGVLCACQRVFVQPPRRRVELVAARAAAPQHEQRGVAARQRVGENRVLVVP
jgi:hypothetical protein